MQVTETTGEGVPAYLPAGEPDTAPDKAKSAEFSVRVPTGRAPTLTGPGVNAATGTARVYDFSSEGDDKSQTSSSNLPVKARDTATAPTEITYAPSYDAGGRDAPPADECKGGHLAPGQFVIVEVTEITDSTDGVNVREPRI